uniref:Afadin n=1 Tax=Trichuris muris TaxID=70415 RepID=A0A5S6QFF6_TRIMR
MEADEVEENAAIRVQLTKLIEDWNANRLDLFALSEPNEELEFHGVMRFYFQESGQRMATKCIRVSSTATTRAVIEALIEKFHADLRLLSTPNYSLWEVHENGEKRKLLPDEKPLLVQLNWHKDDREGRFLLQSERDVAGSVDHLLHLPSCDDVSMKRKLSKREKRELKRLEKQKQLAQAREAEDVTDLLYVEVPNTNFTRTISNPEVVMKKRRERKLEQKLKELGEGGSLKIYGEELSETKPYVTLLLAIKDRADKVIRETLEKYGLGRHSASKFCLVEVRTLPDGLVEERVLDKDDCPLLILAREGSDGEPTFHVRFQGTRILPPATKSRVSSEHEPVAVETLPYLVELNPDGSEPTAAAGRVFVIHPNVIEIGCGSNFNNADAQALCLCGPLIRPRHCVIALMDGVATVTPCEVGAEISVDGQPISETAILRDGCRLCIGRTHLFKFYEKGGEKLSSMQADFLSKPISDHKAHAPVGTSPSPSRLSPAHEQSLPLQSVAVGDTLPAVFEFRDSAVEDLLNAVVCNVDPNKLSFKLASAYILYMCSRYCVAREQYPAMCKLLTRAAEVMLVAIQDNCHNASMLAYWMSNAAETLNFIKLDASVSPRTNPEPQESVADAVQKAFDHLAACLKRDLHAAMPPLLDPQASDVVAIEPCRHILNCVMNLLRLSRVNAALTIQLFSQLFHYINMYLFNWLVSREGATYCRQSWGRRLGTRLSHLLDWAEQQGLELAAECRLERVLQAVHLLEATKTPDHLDAVGSHLTKLNSVQVGHLLDCYSAESAEQPMDRQFVELLVQIAERQVDQVLRNDFQPLQLEEEIDLLLPFLIPDDGYSSEMMRGIPAGLQDFADGLFQQGLGKLVMQPTSSGSWSVHFVTNAPAGDSEAVPVKRSTEASRPPLVHVSFEKDSNGIGLSIVHAQGSDEQMPGIYVKKVVQGSAAAKDGRLQAGDQLIAVNGQNLVGVTQEYAAKLMSQSGPMVNFEVAKGAALYNGLAQWIYQFSPEAGRSGGATGKGVVTGGSASAVAAQAGRGYGIPYVESPAASPMRFKKSTTAVRSPATSPSHLMSRSTVGIPQSARPVVPSTHRYSTSDIYRNVQNNRNVTQTVKQPPPAFYNRMYPAGSTGRSGRSMSASSLLHDAYVDGVHPLMRKEAGEPSSVSSSQMAAPAHGAYLRHREAEMADVHHQRSSSLMTHSRSPAGRMEPYGRETGQYARRAVPPENAHHGYGGYAQTKLGNGGLVIGGNAAAAAQVVATGHAGPHPSANDSLRSPEVAMTRRPPSRMNAAAMESLPNELPVGSNHHVDDFASRRSPYLTDSLRSAHVGPLDNGSHGPADASLGVDALDVNNEEFNVQIETEMEKLMLDELYRLQLKPSLTPAEQRRYRAVRYELEFRRRMRSNSSSSEYHHSVSQRHPAAQEQQETCTSRSGTPGVTREGDYSLRQQHRDRYFEEAERQYQMMAAREWHTRHKQGPAQPEVKYTVQAKSDVAQPENGTGCSSLEAASSVETNAYFMHNGPRAQAEDQPSAAIHERRQNAPSNEAIAQSVKAQVQFDSAPPAVYLVDQLSDNERFMDLVTSASETNPVSGELENFIDAKLENPSPSSILIHHQNEAKYVYQKTDDTPRTQVIGGQEVYKDPRQERLKQLKPVCQQVEGEKLSFRDKMRLFAKEFNEPTPKPGVKSSSAQREIEMNLNVSR